MAHPSIPVEPSLAAWVASGAVHRAVEVFTDWLAAAPDDADATLQVNPWGIHHAPGTDALTKGGRYDLRPAIRVAITFGEKGYRGSAEVVVWAGADVVRIPAALGEALGAAVAGHRTRKRMGTTCHVETAVIVLEPDDGR